MRRVFMRLVCLVTLIALAAPARAGNLPPALTAAYRPAIERLREAYTRASIEGTSSLTLPGRSKARTQEFTMQADGKRRRLDVKTTYQLNMGLTVGALETSVATPYGSLVTVTGPKSEYFDDARETSYAETVQQIDNGCLMNYPYALNSDTTILDMLLSPAVKVTSVKPFKSGGQSLVEIKYEENATHAGHSGLWISSIVLSPSEGWGLRGFNRSTGRGSNEIIQRAKVTYSGEEDGIPLVQLIEAETVQNGRSTRRESIEVSEIDLGAPDNEVFTSFAF